MRKLCLENFCLSINLCSLINSWHNMEIYLISESHLQSDRIYIIKMLIIIKNAIIKYLKKLFLQELVIESENRSVRKVQEPRSCVLDKFIVPREGFKFVRWEKNKNFHWCDVFNFPFPARFLRFPCIIDDTRPRRQKYKSLFWGIYFGIIQNVFLIFLCDYWTSLYCGQLALQPRRLKRIIKGATEKFTDL